MCRHLDSVCLVCLRMVCPLLLGIASYLVLRSIVDIHIAYLRSAV